MLFNSKTNGESLQTVYDFGNNHIVEGDSVMVCLNAGNHYYKISTVGSNGCKGTFDYTVPITVYPKPGADFYWNPETPTTTDNKVTFFPTTKNGKDFKYNWEFTNSLSTSETTMLDTSTAKNPIKDYYENGKFPVMLVVTNEYGCVDTVFKVIVINEDFNVYIPNTFTPNNDGVNDVFNVKGVGLKQEGYYMEIFDRWGTLVYSTKDLNKGWDGTVKGIKAQDGVYIYKVKVVGDNGIGKKEFKGHVTLLK
jgi:gliding motility-associated-like protein